MSIVVTTIPSQPIENESFFTNYSEINNAPVSLNTYVLQNTSNNNVSNTFTVPSGGLQYGPILTSLQTTSTLIKDANNNFYFIGYQGSNYNVYITTINTSPTVFISYLDYPDLLDSFAVGLAIDPNGFFYISLQTKNEILKFNSNGTGGTTFISDGNLISPCGICFGSNGNLYIANRLGNNILEYNSDGSLLSTITNSGFANPYAIGINSLGELYISNIGSSTPDYKIFQIILPGTAPGSITQIADTPGRQSVNMIFDIDNNIYLGDGDDSLIYKLSYNTWVVSTQYVSLGNFSFYGIAFDRFGVQSRSLPPCVFWLRVRDIIID